MIGLKKYLLLGSVAILCTPSPALAQSEGAQTKASEDTPTPDENIGIADIVVTARRTQETLQTTPVAVTVPSGETLDKAQIDTIEALPRIVPGVVIAPSTGQPASATIGIRGQASTDALLALDQAVGQYFDGVYIARSSGALFNFVDVERVEVLRGAQGTLFGRNTTGGAISIISKKPSGELGGMIRGRYGNHDTFEATAVLNIPVAGNEAGFRLVGQHLENGSYGVNRTFDTGLGGDNSDFLRGTFRVAPDSIPLTVTIVGDYSKRIGEGQITGLKSFSANGTASAVLAACSGLTPNPLCPVKTGVVGDTYANYAVDVIGKDNFYSPRLSLIPASFARTWGMAGTLEYELSDSTALKAISAWRGVNTDSLSDNDGTPYVLTGGLRRGEGNIIRQRQFSQEVQLSTKGFDDRLQLILGGFYFNERGRDLSKSFSAFPLGTRRLGYNDSDIRNRSYAGFGQFNFSLTPTIRVTAGTRYTKDKREILRRNRAENTDAAGLPNGTFVCQLSVAAGAPCEAFTKASFDYWSYTFGADWQPADDVFVYLKTNKASRAGGFNPRAIGATPLTFNPETVRDYELGFKLDFLDRRVRWNTAIFQTNYNDIQRTVPAIINGVLSNTIINAATARIRGVENELTLQPTRGLQLGVSATYLAPKFKDFTIPLTLTTFQDVTDTPYSFAPKWSYTLFADYTTAVGAGELNVRMDYNYRSKVYQTGPLVGPGFQQQFRETAKIPGYGLLNGQISYTFDNPNVEVALYGQNLTKKKYFQRLLAIENSLGVTAYSPGQPRFYGLKVTYKFGSED